MAGQAGLIDLLFRKGFEADDLVDVPSAFYMFGARPMARLATVTALKRRFEVRGRFKTLFVKIFVAGLADVYTNILSGGLAWNRRTTLLTLGSQGRLNEEQ